MLAINRKLLRDFWHLRSQAFAITLVIASGIATYLLSLTTLDSLKLTQAVYYQDYAFADVFVSLKRAPNDVIARIAGIPGVDKVQSRVVGGANVDVEGFSDPVVGQLVSIPDNGQPELNQLYLRRGRLISNGREDEVVLSDVFANAHNLKLDDQISAVINGRGRKLRIVGIALTPEYIYELGPGMLFPDNQRFGVMWMARTPLGKAFDMDGAFNDLALTVTADARLDDIIERIDNILEPYGGLGAYSFEDQMSYDYLTEEFKMLKNMAVMFPLIFLSVSTFLLNVVITRLISTQREQVAALKAFGYSNFDVGVHFLKLVLLISTPGIIVGLALGTWLGHGMSELYMDFYRFPFLKYRLETWIAVSAVFISVSAATIGTLHAVRRASQLPPAEAMRPEPPANYRETLIEKMGFQNWFSQPTRMIARHLERKPVKSLLTVTGIALACAIMMVGSFQEDAVDYMMNVQYGLATRDDLTVTFSEPTSKRAMYDLLSMEGMRYGEPFRAVPVRLRSGHRNYRTAIQGLEADSSLKRILDTNLQPQHLPPDGIVLTDRLAQVLGVAIGERITVEVLEGNQPIRETFVAGLVNEYVGLSAYMRRDALNRLMREGEAISGVLLAADPQHMHNIFAELKEMPRVAGTTARQNAIKNFYDNFAETLLVFTFINTLLAGSVAFGVVYNSARIAVAERGRELASLRVLGFTRGEISYIMLGELTVLTLAAIPLGLLIGRGLCAYIASNLQTDLYRVPLITEPSTYAFAATVVLVSALLSGLIVRGRLDHLDLVAVLKTKE